MFRTKPGWILLVASSLIWADAAQPWSDKAATDWTDDDAKLVLSKSPWAKDAMVDYVPPQQTKSNQRPRGRGGNVRVGVGGVSVGGGRRGGIGGYPGGTNTGDRQPRTRRQDSGDAPKPPVLTLRWETAKPVHEAEVMTHDLNSPASVDSKKYYAIAVYGVTNHLSSDDADNLKKKAVLQRDGQKDIKASKVQVLQRDDGPIVVYLFPRSKQLSKDFVTFESQVGQWRVTKTFSVDEMVYQSKLAM